jgi:hypothetical protein
MWRGTKVVMLVAALTAVALIATPVAGSQGGGATQLVISGQTLPGSTTGNLDGFGIWVWCEDPDAGNPYAGACAGSMYFYNIELTKPVFGGVAVLDENTSFSVNLASPDRSIVCTVSGSLPATKGPRNTITVTCSSPSRSGMLSNVVVVVT